MDLRDIKYVEAWYLLHLPRVKLDQSNELKNESDRSHVKIEHIGKIMPYIKSTYIKRGYQGTFGYSTQYIPTHPIILKIYVAKF